MKFQSLKPAVYEEMSRIQVDEASTIVLSNQERDEKLNFKNFEKISPPEFILFGYII